METLLFIFCCLFVFAGFLFGIRWIRKQQRNDPYYHKDVYRAMDEIKNESCENGYDN